MPTLEKVVCLTLVLGDETHIIVNIHHMEFKYLSNDFLQSSLRHQAGDRGSV